MDTDGIPLSCKPDQKKPSRIYRSCVHACVRTHACARLAQLEACLPGCGIPGTIPDADF